jgi:hypothetical protein
MFNSNYLYFIHIYLPPSPYDLKRAKDVAKKKSKDAVFQRWAVEDVEKSELLRNIFPLNLIMVSKSEIVKKSKEERNNLIHGSIPALASNKTKEQLKKFAGTPQFAFGQYYESKNLFLVDDIMEWSHHRISWEEIRTAKSFIETNKKI